MNESKLTKVVIMYTLPCEEVFTEEVLGAEATVSYVFRMYHGTTKVNGLYKNTKKLVDIKAYGMFIHRTLDFKQPMSLELILDLQKQGYKTFPEARIATLEKDFGFVTAQNYELSWLIQKLNTSDVLGNFEAMCHFVRFESSQWGDPVLDVDGRPVYNDHGYAKRDAFARVARLTIKKQFSGQRRVINHLLHSVREMGTSDSDMNNSKGVDL